MSVLHLTPYSSGQLLHAPVEGSKHCRECSGRPLPRVLPTGKICFGRSQQEQPPGEEPHPCKQCSADPIYKLALRGSASAAHGWQPAPSCSIAHWLLVTSPARCCQKLLVVETLPVCTASPSSLVNTDCCPTLSSSGVQGTTLLCAIAEHLLHTSEHRDTRDI